MSPNEISTALADRYRLRRELGAGGMATVYLADDLKHRRQVAIKVLRPELGVALGADRFVREITTTANLRHPNILPLYDSGERGGFLFYVMPYVEGESLRSRMDREKQVPMDEALRIADEVADALHYAHGRGVVHRDIKPENILLEDGRAVVADFGIAHAVNASGDKLTMTGLALGTPHYMSPEQASGEPVDARTDVYALGCMLYERLAGTPPFTGPNAMAIMARHMTDPVPRLTTVRPAVAPNVTAAIERALAKAPADRFSTVAEWREALRDATSTTSAVSAGGAPLFKPPPEPATALLGRQDAIDAAAGRLKDGARVLTVTGVGGTGKTRLAIELFRRLHADYPGGAAFVSLASVTSPGEVMPTVSATLDIAEAHGRSALDALATVIGDRRVLLVLDNLEQVIDAAGDVAALVSRCPGLHVIATSRRPLKIGAEAELPLSPLALPADGAIEADELMRCPSVALFVQRAEKVKPGFALSAANAVSIAAICRSLDGLPLALELAAARVRILDPAMLLQRLDHALDLLSSGDRDLPLRQRTLRATISWSYSLLDEAEQRLLRRLSVFHEGWTLEAMEQVCYAPEDRWAAVDGLESLVEKGLVRVVADGGRYALLETIRAFAAEQLHAGGEVDAVRHAHAEFFVEFTREVSAGIHGTTQLDTVARAKSDLANAHAAILWSTTAARSGDADALERGLRICGHLNWFWHIAGHHLTAHGMLDDLIALHGAKGRTRGRAAARLTDAMIASVTGEWDRCIAEAAAGRADGLALGEPMIAIEGMMVTGYGHLHGGRLQEAIAALDEAIAHTNGVNDFFHALSMSLKGMAVFAGGEAEAGIAMVESARVIQERIGDCEGGGVALSLLASMKFSSGDLDGALRIYADAETTLDQVGDKPEVARVQCEMGYVALAGNDVDGARRHFRRALRTYDEVGSPRGVGQALIGLAATEAGAGNPERAVTIAAAAQLMSARAGVVVDHPMAPGVAERIEALRASIPRQQLDELVSSGAAMSPAAVLAMVAG